jgi:hypothetical protein
MQYVHEECLKTWILARHKEVRVSCELCNVQFKMRLDVGLVCRLKSDKHSCFGRVIYYLVLLLCLFALCVTAWALAGQIETTEDAKRTGMIIAMIVNCMLLTAVVVVIMVSFMSDTKCVHVLNSWSILARVPDAAGAVTSTVQTSSYSYEASISSSDAGIPCEPEILILPEVTRVRGKQVQVPRLEPSLPRMQTTSASVQAFVVYPGGQSDASN